MYKALQVKIPQDKGRIIRKKIKGITYIYYQLDSKYDAEKGYSVPHSTTIGKACTDDDTMMFPNEKYFIYYPDTDIPEEKGRQERSSCLRVGTYIVINKIIKEYQFQDILKKYYDDKDTGLFLDLAAYSIVTENNAGQYYPDYAYNHFLFTKDIKVYSDAHVSEFFRSVTDDQTIGFLNSWNEGRDHREKIYFSYDSTNKNSQAGQLEIVEYGEPKVDMGLPIYNWSIAYDTHNREALFYEKYPGSINDVSQLQQMVSKAKAYGYRNVGFILDRGYFSRENLDFLDKSGYSFIIMVKGMSDLVSQIVLENKGQFERKRTHYISEYRVYGMTVKQKMYQSDKKDRYFHIYYSNKKEAGESAQLEEHLEQMKKIMKKRAGKEVEFGSLYQKYFSLYYDEEEDEKGKKKSKKFRMGIEKIKVTEYELSLCGYYVIVTSDDMTYREALDKYKSRDASEKLFRADKSFLGNKSMRVYTDEAMSAKISIEFVALIIRNYIYRKLKKAAKDMGKKQNYMTVPAAIKELEKIELVRLTDEIYHLDHAITATQKVILEAFGMDGKYIKNQAELLSKQLNNTV